MSSSNISRKRGRWLALFVVFGWFAVMRNAAAQNGIKTAEVTVSGAEGAVLFVDGKEIGTLPLADSMILPAGSHRFSLQRGGQKAESDTLMLPAYRFAELHLQIAGRSVIAVLHVTPTLLLMLDPAELPPALSDVITQSVGAATKQENVRLLRGERHRALMQQKELLLRCLHEDDCQDPIFDKGEISYVLSVEVTRDGASDPQNYTTRATLLDVRTRDSSFRAEERCASCSADRAAAKVGRLATRLLLDSMKQPRDPAAVASRNAKRRAALNAERAQAEKAATAAATERRSTRKRPVARMLTGGILLGSGVLLGSFGASALLLHGRCQDGAESLDLCSSIYNTRPVGAGLLASGAALAVTGTVLLAVPSRER